MPIYKSKDLPADAFASGTIEVKSLGKGTFANVQLRRCPKTGIKFAAKGVIRRSEEDQMYFNASRDEVKILTGVQNHPNVVKMLGFYLDEDQGHCITYLEYHKRGDLARLVGKNPGGLPLERYFGIFGQLVDAVEYIHAEGFVHFDIKPANILMGEGDRPILTDFNLAKNFILINNREILQFYSRGTPDYMAPEMCDHDVLARGLRVKPLDIWSCGVVLFYMATSKLPWSVANTKDKEFRDWAVDDEHFHSNALTLQSSLTTQKYWNRFDSKGFEFMHNILAVSVESRFPDVASMRAHSWFQQTRRQLSEAESASDSDDSLELFEFREPRGQNWPLKWFKCLN